MVAKVCLRSWKRTCSSMPSHFQQFAVDPGHRVRAPVAAGAGDGNRMGLSGAVHAPRTKISTACWDSATLRMEFLVFGSVTTSSPSMRVTCLLTERMRSFTFRSPHWSASSPAPQAAGQLQEEHGQDAVLPPRGDIPPASPAG